MPKSGHDTMVLRTVYLPKATDTKLVQLAQAKDRSKGDLIRRAVGQFLSRLKRAAKRRQKRKSTRK